MLCGLGSMGYGPYRPFNTSPISAKPAARPIGCSNLAADSSTIRYTTRHLTALSIAFGVDSRPFHTAGMLENQYYLFSASDSQRDILADIFNGDITDRYTECLFHPDLKLTFSGREGSRSGRLDAHIGKVT